MSRAMSWRFLAFAEDPALSRTTRANLIHRAYNFFFVESGIAPSRGTNGGKVITLGISAEMGRKGSDSFVNPGD